MAKRIGDTTWGDAIGAGLLAHMLWGLMSMFVLCCQLLFWTMLALWYWAIVPTGGWALRTYRTRKIREGAGR